MENEKNITAEEFFRNKLSEINPYQFQITLSREMITAEQGMRWAHEFHTMKLKEQTETGDVYRVVRRERGGYCVERNGVELNCVFIVKKNANAHMKNLIKFNNALKGGYSETV